MTSKHVSICAVLAMLLGNALIAACGGEPGGESDESAVSVGAAVSASASASGSASVTPGCSCTCNPACTGRNYCKDLSPNKDCSFCGCVPN